MEFSYPFELEAHAEDFLLTFPEFPEILSTITTSEVESGAVRMLALDAVKHALQARIDYNDEIPRRGQPPADVDPEKFIALPPLTSMKVMLYLELRRRGGTKSALAKHIGITATDMGRLLDLFHESRSDQLLLAFERLNIVLRTRFDVIGRRA